MTATAVETDSEASITAYSPDASEQVINLTTGEVRLSSSRPDGVWLEHRRIGGQVVIVEHYR